MIAVQRLFCFLLFFCGVFAATVPAQALETNLSLDQVVETALKNNPRIDIALQQCRQGQGFLTQARSGYLPHVGVEGNLGRQHIKDLQPEDEDMVGHGSIKLSQLIYDFGKTTGAIDAGRFSLQAAEANLHQLMQDVVLDVKRAFYNEFEKKRLVEVAKEAVDNYTQHHYRAVKYFEAGVRTKIDVTNAQVNLSNARLDLLRAESNLKAARVELEKVMGIRPNQGNYALVSQDGPLKQLAASKPAMSYSLDLLLATAFGHRADMRQVNLLVKASESDVIQARSGYFPSIGATAGYDDYETDLTPLQDQWQVGVGLSWKLFSGFQTRGEMVEARARFRELQAAFRDLELAITQEVTDSFLRADENRKGVDLADEVLGLARENLALAEGRYKAGLNDMIEFNDAQLGFTRAQSNLVTTYYAYLTALARIEHATGVTTGLEVDEAAGGVSCNALTWHGKVLQTEKK